MGDTSDYTSFYHTALYSYYILPLVSSLFPPAPPAKSSLYSPIGDCWPTLGSLGPDTMEEEGE